MKGLQIDLVDDVVGRVVVAEVHVAAGVADEDIVIIVVEDRHANLQQSARGGERSRLAS